MDKLWFRLLLSLFVLAFSTLSQAFVFIDGCLDHRWIAIKTAQAKECPTATGWLESSLFARPGQLENTLLDDYCVYEKLLFGGSGGTPGVPYELQKLVDDGELNANLEKDCLVVGPLASADVVSIQQKHLFLQTGKNTLPVINQDLSPVRLAIIDSLPTASDATLNLSTNSPHGASIAAIAHKLVCEEKTGVCYAKISSQLAMSYIANKTKEHFNVYRDTFNGGYFGSISELATAIRNEVASWKKEEPDSHLVINLSLGWNPNSWGGAGHVPEKYAASVSSVYHAIEDAVCRGALVVSAAGNQGKNDVGDQYPMLPAKWEELPAPDSRRCKDITGEYAFEENKTKLSGSLVYAVSGIDSLGQPLKNTREYAKTRIAAYADHASVDSAITTKEDTLTGSSVSTIVVSSIASMVWAHRPDLNAIEVMDLIYRSGNKLNYFADFFLLNTTTDKQARRASMCLALTEACQNGYCNLPANCHWQQTHPNFLSSSLFTAPFNQSYQLAELTACRMGSSDCVLSETDSGPISPWILPQPDPLPCPNCLNPVSQSALVVETSASYTGEISEAQLVVDNVIYELPNFSLGDRILIEDFHADPVINKAYISVLIDGSHRMTIPLLVSQ